MVVLKWPAAYYDNKVEKADTTVTDVTFYYHK